jgi:hypothetical protein
MHVAGGHALALDAQAQAVVAGRLRDRVSAIQRLACVRLQADRQVLPGLEGRHGMAVCRREVEGADDAALVDDACDLVGPPGLRQAQGLAARLGLGPGACEGGVGREVAEGPAQRQRLAQTPA